MLLLGRIKPGNLEGNKMKEICLLYVMLVLYKCTHTASSTANNTQCCAFNETFHLDVLSALCVK